MALKDTYQQWVDGGEDLKKLYPNGIAQYMRENDKMPTEDELNVLISIMKTGISLLKGNLTMGDAIDYFEHDIQTKLGIEAQESLF